ncbi:unnamed protein product [Protopolystoma xenopodis]|uniref:Uncharacterized protein n=1 Tax=Protopolystoma xenopodis TaxID=117903 RepID=A0A448XKP1_9PLAT|nr:unnamed protein product [Protopolystoma xenopodis]
MHSCLTLVDYTWCDQDDSEGSPSPSPSPAERMRASRGRKSSTGAGSTKSPCRRSVAGHLAQLKRVSSSLLEACGEGGAAEPRADGTRTSAGPRRLLLASDPGLSAETDLAGRGRRTRQTAAPDAAASSVSGAGVGPGVGAGPGQVQRSRTSPALLANRQPPIYSAVKRNPPDEARVWMPVGHVRYLLSRDPSTGEAQWTSDADPLICTPR